MKELYIMCWFMIHKNKKSEFRRKYYRTKKIFDEVWDGEKQLIDFYRHNPKINGHSIEGYYTDIHTPLTMIKSYK